MSKKRFFKIGRYEILIGVLVSLIPFFYFIRLLDRLQPGPQPWAEQIVNKILPKVLSGDSKNNIINFLSKRDREFIEKHQIGWIEGLMPIKTKKGLLAVSYLPPDHVVVYGNLLVEYNGTYRANRFYNAVGEMYGLPEKSQLDKRIKITEYGVNKILLGDIFDVNESIANGFGNDRQIVMYLLLRDLIDNNKRFLSVAVELAARRETDVNIWVNKILVNSIISPSYVVAKPEYNNEEVFYNSLEKWYETNKDRIEYSNKMLFE